MAGLVLCRVFLCRKRQHNQDLEGGPLTGWLFLGLAERMQTIRALQVHPSLKACPMMAWEIAISALGVGEPAWRAAFRVDGADTFRLRGEASVPILLCETTSGHSTHQRDNTG